MTFDEYGLPILASMRMPEETHRLRRGFVNASEIPTILSGTPEQRRDLAAYHLGAEPEDLTQKLYVLMGIWTEPLNLALFGRSMELAVSRKGLSVSSERYPWLRATLDGWIPSLGIHVECKHVNEFSKLDEVVEKYTGQLQAQMISAGTSEAYMSILIGTGRHSIVKVNLDPFWWDEILPILETWHKAISEGRLPDQAQPAPPPPTYEKLREIDLTSDNEWADAADRWLKNKDAATAFDKATGDLKAKVPADAGKVWGHGVVVTRNKARSLSIKKGK